MQSLVLALGVAKFNMDVVCITASVVAIIANIKIGVIFIVECHAALTISFCKKQTLLILS